MSGAWGAPHLNFGGISKEICASMDYFATISTVERRAPWIFAAALGSGSLLDPPDHTVTHPSSRIRQPARAVRRPSHPEPEILP